MFKVVFSFILFSTSVFALNYNDNKVDSWRNGFITAYKAMITDSSLQGIASTPMQTKKYIIYFNADSDKVAQWDKLMVQMFGYSSTIHKPIRTTNDWIIFSSYNSKATAMQELDILNKQIFSNSKEHKLELFINDEDKVFFNDKAMLYDSLTQLKKLLKDENTKALIEKTKELESIAQEEITIKKKELEDNQKVAIVYVDKNKQIINDVEALKFDNNSSSSASPVKIKIKEQETIPANVSKKEEALQNISLEENKRYVIPDRGTDVPIFSVAQYQPSKRVGTLKLKETIEVLSLNKYGWYKLSNNRGYLASHLVREINSKLNLKIPHKSVQKTVPDIKKIYFKLTKRDVFFYSLNNITEDSVVDSTNFTFIAFNGEVKDKYVLEKTIKDTDGVEYVKFADRNLFVEKNDIAIIDN